MDPIRPDAPNRRLALLVMAAALILALVPAVAVTRHLLWPFDLDAFRDIAAAQAIRDGSWSGDPFYVGEHAWYTPLVPAIVALLSAALHQPVAVVAVRSGPWLNLLGAIAFGAAAWRLIGPAAGAFATIAFLFVPAHPPAWAAGTYTPWLFPGLVGQAFLYLGLILCSRFVESGSYRLAVAIGALIGVAFLAHAAHGVLLAATLTVAAVTASAFANRLASPRGASDDACLRNPAKASHRTPLLAIAIAAAVAIIVVAPFFWPLIARYHLHTLNRAPATWPYTPGYPAALAATLRWPRTWPFAVLAIAGLVSLARRRDAGAVVLWSWGAASLLLSACSLMATWYHSWPPIVPAYHFEYQVRAWGWMLAGAGAWSLVAIGAERLSRSSARLRPVLLMVVAVLFVAVFYPRYLQRPAFREAAAAARVIGARPDRQITAWIASSTPRDAVFLASNDDGLLIVAPAGRHVVAVDAPFSNPYVDYHERRAARDAMLAAIDARDWARFRTLAARYGVTHVLAHGPRASALLASPAFAPAYGTPDAVLVSVSAVPTAP
jgi:uncharacterized membrane protein (UPF0136 family)